jgi:hypothetical protein
VTLVCVVIYIWAALAAIEALALFLNRDAAEWTARYGEDEIVILAVAQVILAVALFAVVSGVKWARLAVAVVVTIRLSALTWFMLGHFGLGAFTWSTLVSLALGLFVLWALYRRDESDSFYAGYA